ncbi:MAG: hypothetical protein OEM39_07275 [Acidimicrobiia bacterium]|nr:hypothetical protein [Acidimicrobiia bacterium]MDH3463409.1 hypothetical protein [Acidimicrobiia bacterium]
MIVAAINHRVPDYDRWKAVYDTFPPTSGGARFARVNRAVGDANLVTVVAGFDSVDAAKTFLENPDLKAKMREAGIVDPPRIEIYEEVEVI